MFKSPKHSHPLNSLVRKTGIRNRFITPNPPHTKPHKNPFREHEEHKTDTEHRNRASLRYPEPCSHQKHAALGNCIHHRSNRSRIRNTFEHPCRTVDLIACSNRFDGHVRPLRSHPRPADTAHETKEKKQRTGPQNLTLPQQTPAQAVALPIHLDHIHVHLTQTEGRAVCPHTAADEWDTRPYPIGPYSPSI